ncbi:hypothetical protein [Vibrio sinaloensis]|uniref:hypothetical protein n=1 Tax=Photobacterium sp. (strain ATCC 43367) TaxID=379097 RepID=UPI00057C9985|nr:hypothetical protein [Vibrio sinaloensis]KHT38043.1 hypothetical protein RJ46_18755 [Vibrio sinaloensis]
MKRLLTIMALLVASSVNAFEANLSGKTLNEFFIVASKAFDKSIVVDPKINGELKLYQSHGAANFRDVWFSVMRAHNLTYAESDTVIRVQLRNQLKAGNEIVTRTYKLSHLTADEVLAPLRESLRVQSSILDVPDVTAVSSIIAGSALMVTAPKSLQSNVASFINAVDSPVQQIKIRAAIVETLDGSLRDLTVDMKAGAGALKAAFTGSVAGFMRTDPNLKVTTDDFSAFIRFIESSDKTQLLSSPELTVLHGHEGLISVGQELPFVTGSFTTESDSSDKPFQTIERKDVGLSLFVKPLIGHNGDIKLQIRQELSRVDKSVEASDIVTSKRQIDTTLMVRVGDTVALGGMTAKDSQEVQVKVPLLGDIPLLGVLFRSESEKSSNRTLSVVLYIEQA